MKKYIKTGIGILIIVVLAFLYAHIDKTHIYMTEMQIRQHLSVQGCFWKEKR